MRTRCRATAALICGALLAACHDSRTQRPDRDNFTAAVDDYLAQRGRLCIAKYDWPIVVTDADRQAHSVDAEQMSVLEKSGLAIGRDLRVARKDGAEATTYVAAHEYTLTAEGRKYYVHMPVVVATATQHVTHPADFCVARLTLDRVRGWEAPQPSGGRMATSVLFSYRIDPAPWTRTPDARRAFPSVTRAIDNAGVLQLRLGVHLEPKGWVADELSG